VIVVKKGKTAPASANNSVATNDSAAIIYKPSDNSIDETVLDKPVVFRKGCGEILDVVLEDAPGDAMLGVPTHDQLKRARAAFLADRGR